jgi:hypothetical protein
MHKNVLSQPIGRFFIVKQRKSKALLLSMQKKSFKKIPPKGTIYKNNPYIFVQIKNNRETVANG